MTQLPHGCHCGKISVYPANWKSVRASTKKDWYIFFRFYDPTRTKEHPKGKLVVLKGMNDLKNLKARQQATERLYNTTIRMLTVEGYNPITGKSVAPLEVTTLVDPYTPFMTALNCAAKEITHVSKSVRRDLKSVLGFVSTACAQLGLTDMPISHTSRKHIKAILKQIEKNRAPESAHRFNKNRTYLMMLFKELIEFEALDTDPVSVIEKKEPPKKIRPVLNHKERKEVNDHLLTNHYTFWRFTQVFFHSGARVTEMLSLRTGDVDLQNQVFKVTVKKGKQQNEVLKPIKDIVLPLWMELMKEAKTDQVLFSKDLRPGPKVIRYEQITRRWSVHVKKKLGIDADFYSLKHLNLDETAELLSIDDAAAAADHTDKAVTMKFYASGEKMRQLKKLKKLGNTFAE